MASKGKYHMIPQDEDPPSPTQGGGSGINPRIETIVATTVSSSPRFIKERKLGFQDLNITFYMRLLSFVFFLTGTIIIGVNRVNYGFGNHDSSVPSICFMTFANARNLFVMLTHLFRYILPSGARKITIGYRIDGLAKMENSSGLHKGKLMSLIIDVALMISLLLVLLFGFANRSWNSNEELQDGYKVAFTGLPFYFFSIFDCGTPSSIGLTAYWTLEPKRASIQPDSSETEYRDVEALIPVAETEQTI